MAAASARQALVIFNSRSSGGAVDPEPWLEPLRVAGLGVRLLRPRSPDAMRRLIRDHLSEHRETTDRILIGGGDGTLSHALPVLLEEDVPLGVIPVGTANDLARTLGLPGDPIGACQLAAGDSVRRIDVGLANGRPFLNAASMGLGVRINRGLDGDTKGLWGAHSYLRSGWDAVHGARSFRATASCDGRTEHLHCLHVTVGNGIFHGGGIRVAEDASISDGRLDLYSLPPSGVARLAVLLPWLRLGAQARWRDVRTLHGARIRLVTSRRLEVFADGEHLTETPVEFEVRQGALAVFAPDEPVETPFLLRDEAEVALNELLAACRAAGEDYAALAKSLDETDPGAARLFRELAETREAVAKRMEPLVRRLGEPPHAPDPDRQSLRRLAARFKGKLAGEPLRGLVQDRLAAEAELRERAQAALDQDLPEAARELVGRLAESLQRDRARLAELAPEA